MFAPTEMSVPLLPPAKPSRKAALTSEASRRRRQDRAAVEAIDCEQYRLAQILHDTICQSLSGIALLTRVALRKLESASPQAAQGAADVAELGRAIASASSEIHGLVRSLRPTGGHSPNPVPALADLREAVSRIIPCDLDVPEPILLPDPFAATQFVQIARQAANDALGHAGVSRISISLRAQDRQVILTIRDDCPSLDRQPAAELRHNLKLMRLRASAIGATLTTSCQQGATVVCTLPRFS